MANDHAQLSAAATTLDELTDRVQAIADRYAGTAREHLAADLFEVERALRTAGRHLAKVVRSLE